MAVCGKVCGECAPDSNRLARDAQERSDRCDAVTAAYGTGGRHWLFCQFCSWCIILFGILSDMVRYAAR